MYSKISIVLSSQSESDTNFQTLDHLPKLFDPQPTPLWTLLSTICSSERVRIMWVTVGPSLGYRTIITFNNAESLWYWLGADQRMECCKQQESRHYSIDSFLNVLTISDLLSASSNYPQHLVGTDIRSNDQSNDI